MKNISKVLLLSVCGIYVAFVVIFIGFRIGSQSVTLVPAEAQSDSAHRTSNAEMLNGRININTASADTLAMLPGVGEKLSLRIVEYRSRYGPFQHKSDLTKINGIGQSLVDSISDYITLGG